ncbi:MAG: UDP-N-acetylmuramate dehydrogenase [Acidimicrobiales bacterium]
MSSTAAAHAARLLGGRAREQLALGPLTTYRVGGAAAVGVEPTGEDDLLAIAAVVAETGVPVLVVGRGSNLLVADRGFAGLAVVIGAAFDWIEIDGSAVRAGAATALPVVARRAAAAGLTGLEWAVGVPGSVGGAVRMNAGGHGSDIAGCLQRARIVDLASATGGWRSVSDLELAYRHSNLAPTEVVVVADLRGQPGDRAVAEQAIAEIVAWRRANQPGGQNAGSVFTNPPGDSAGRLVDQAGLKGHRLGSAEVSTKHANFIQADDGGSADDVRRLIELVRVRVLESSGVDLHPEVRLIGFDGPYAQETTR